METGIKGYREITVTDEMTAAKVGSGSLEVFATPCMISLIEGTAASSVAGNLKEGQSTVGTSIDVSHVSPTPVGMKVTCETELVQSDRRKLVFSVKAFDEKGLIGEGTHERFIVDNQPFLEKCRDKLK